MVFDAIWLAVLLQSKRQIQLCCFFGVPRVSSHIAESPMRSTTRVCGVCMCVYIHTSGGGVCVCWGGCLGFHSLAAPYTVRTHQRWREREGGRDGWGGRRRRDRTRRWRGCTDSFTRALLGKLRPLTQADRYWTIETRGSYSPLFFSAIILLISNPH